MTSVDDYDNDKSFENEKIASLVNNNELVQHSLHELTSQDIFSTDKMASGANQAIGSKRQADKYNIMRTVLLMLICLMLTGCFGPPIMKVAGLSVTAVDVATIPIKNEVRKEVMNSNKEQIALYDEQ